MFITKNRKTVSFTSTSRIFLHHCYHHTPLSHSLLGPILFLIFINDIASCMSHSTLTCFADDTIICRSISDLNNVHELQSDLEEVAEWSASNNMALHEDKFEYICHLANKRNPLH